MNALGNLVKKLREDKALPLRKVAAYLDIDQAILSKMERGQRIATREQVVKLARYFKVKEEDLLVAWLSDKLVTEIEHEDFGLKALQVAEEKVAYRSKSKTDRQTIIKKIKDYFSKDKRISIAWLFGSFAREEEEVGSDIDIMIEVSPDAAFSLFDLADVQFQLEKVIPVKVDIVMREGVKPKVMERISGDLIMVYERQKDFRKRKA